MRRCLCAALTVLLVLGFFVPLASAVQEGIVVKVTTGKGALKLRGRPDASSRVLGEIPNGTCVLLTEEGDAWCRVIYGDQCGYCVTEYLTVLREADPSILAYRVLRRGEKGEDVLALKRRLQELGYIRSGSELTNVYNDVARERVMLFERQTGMTEDGVASQELQAYLFSDAAPVCTQTLPRVRSRAASGTGQARVICGCCFGEGCECCGFAGWIAY